MIIYVNQFTIIKESGLEPILKSVGGWLKQITKKHFTVEQLISGEEFGINKFMVRTYSATMITPKLYSILLSHPDISVNGREWITEISIKENENDFFVSILLETKDISTQVKEIPLSTRPKLITYLKKNTTFSTMSMCTKPAHLINNDVSFNELKDFIFNSKRQYPIVLVHIHEKIKIDIKYIQEQLIGLAQVIIVESDIHTYELEKYTTSRYCVWDGSINIIYPYWGKSFCHNTLILSKKLLELISDNKVYTEILSLITHITNRHNKKYHFSPTHVRAKRQKDYRLQLQEKFRNLNNNDEYKELAESAFKELEENDEIIKQLEDGYQNQINDLEYKYLELEDTNEELKNKIFSLNSRIDSLEKSTLNDNRSLLSYGIESEFYDNEVSDLILEVLEKELSTLETTTRRYCLIQDLLSENCILGKREEYLELCKKLLKNYKKITPGIRNGLKSIGLEVDETSKEHNKIKFLDDNRFKVTIAKTPSDSVSAGNNNVSYIKKELF